VIHDAALFNEFHALLVMTGKDYCKPTPRCSACPLDKLPHAVGAGWNQQA